jgi:hypothetical protein
MRNPLRLTFPIFFDGGATEQGQVPRVAAPVVSNIKSVSGIVDANIKSALGVNYVNVKSIGGVQK